MREGKDRARGWTGEFPSVEEGHRFPALLASATLPSPSFENEISVEGR